MPLKTCVTYAQKLVNTSIKFVSLNSQQEITVQPYKWESPLLHVVLGQNNKSIQELPVFMALL
jgi:hypothetical protein